MEDMKIMEEKKMNRQTVKIIKVVVPIVIALLSMLVIARVAGSAEFHAKTIESLDDKKTTVMELTAASTAASAAITLIPGDAATPIATKLADMSSYFLIVICALYLEKYLVTITGYATFMILIPLVCLLCLINVFQKGENIKSMLTRMSIKIGAFAIAIVCVIPVSVQVSNMIEATYSSSMESTIESAKEATNEISDAAADSDDEEGILSNIISTVKDGVSGLTTKVENVLNNFIEALAVMIVTSCVIPILVLLFFVWIIKILLGVNINLPMKRE